MKAYSYVRFSSAQQAKGTSLERQTKAAIKYAKFRNWELDTTTTFQDLGVSAFHGNHDGGAFGEFLQALQEGLITTPCALIVESIDRLGRDELGKAQSRFQSLLNQGVTVVTLSDNQEYTPESANDLGRIMICLVNMHRAHEESQVKSMRSKGAWDKCRETGNIKLMGGITPGWLKRKEDRSGFDLIPERVETVKRIFKMALNGFGSLRIARQLNEEDLKSFSGKQWSSGCIAKMLARRTVLGEWQPREQYIVNGKKRYRNAGEPHKIYPQVIDEVSWARVQSSRKGRDTGGLRGFRGRAKLGRSIFTQLLFCSCGAPMRFTHNKGKQAYVHCRRNTEYGQDCGEKTCFLNYKKTVASLLVGLQHLDWTSIFPELRTEGLKSIQHAENNIEALHIRHSDLVERQSKLIDALETGNEVLILVKRLQEIESDIKSLNETITQEEINYKVMVQENKEFMSTREAFDGLPKLLKEADGVLMVSNFLRSRFKKITVDWDSRSLVCSWADGGIASAISIDADHMAKDFGGVPLAEAM